MILEVEGDGDHQVLKTRQYYLGDDPEMLAEIDRNVKHHIETTGKQPPTS